MGYEGTEDATFIMSADSSDDVVPPTVLVVDDERGLADLYEIWLADDYDVRIAYDGESAVDNLDDDVDVVLLDRQMPDLTGDEVLETIRERGIECRVAMVTAVDPDLDIVEMGFDDYVQKPVGKDRLHEVVAGLLDRSTYNRAVQSYFTAARKRALLEERTDAHSLEDSEEFQDLLVEIDSLQEEMMDVTDGFGDDDFEALFMELDDSER